MLYKTKRQYLLTCNVSRYCLLALCGRITRPTIVKWLSLGTDYCITFTPPFVSKDFNKYTFLNNNTPHSEQRRTVLISETVHAQTRASSLLNTPLKALYTLKCRTFVLFTFKSFFNTFFYSFCTDMDLVSFYFRKSLEIFFREFKKF